MTARGSRQPIESIAAVRKKVIVYNLQTDAPNTFLANGFLVHNKGGGGGGGQAAVDSTAAADSTAVPALPAAPTFFACFFYWHLYCARSASSSIIAPKKGRGNENLDFVYSSAQVAKKGGKTIKLLQFLSRQDPTMAPEALRKQAETTFLKLQQCWMARSYGPMQPLLMPDLFRDHSLQIAEMVRNHEIDVIGDLRVDRIDLVNVRYTLKEEQREFTALITATACDYYLDDRTHKRLRGDTAPAQFQEFWTFHFHNKAWLLREIEQTRESDALKTENFFEQFTDTGVEQIYGKEAAQQGQAGPWLEKAVETKETRIERMLNFLVQTDKIWDRQAMMETTRRIFLEMMAAWESGNPGRRARRRSLSRGRRPFQGRDCANKAQGLAVEFRNLCVRKVELVLVRNFADKTQDDFIARVRAHAQKILRRGGQVSRQDEDVVPFEQYHLGPPGELLETQRNSLRRCRPGGGEGGESRPGLQPRTGTVVLSTRSGGLNMNRSRHIRPLGRNLIHDRPPEQLVRLIQARADKHRDVQSTPRPAHTSINPLASCRVATCSGSRFPRILRCVARANFGVLLSWERWPRQTHFIRFEADPNSSSAASKLEM